MAPESSAALAAPARGFDAFRPLAGLLIAVLAALVALPFFWLCWYALTDAKGAFTTANFIALATDPTMTKPFVLALAMAACVSALSCAIAAPLAWLVARTDMPGRGAVRAQRVEQEVEPLPGRHLAPRVLAFDRRLAAGMKGGLAAAFQFFKTVRHRLLSHAAQP